MFLLPIETAKREFDEAEFEVEVIKRVNQIEEIFWRFPKVGEKIFKNLDVRDLEVCRSVSKWWQKFIDSLEINPIQKIVSLFPISNPTLKSREFLLHGVWMPPEKHQEYLEHTVHNLISRSKEIIKPTNKSCSLNELFFGACRKKEHNDFEIDKSYESPYWALGKFIFDNLEYKNPTIKVEMRKLVGRRGLRRYPRFYDAPDMKKHDISVPTTALHIAAYENHYEMCQLIMSSIGKPSFNSNFHQ